ITIHVAGVKQGASFTANENSGGTKNVSCLKKFEGHGIRVTVRSRRAFAGKSVCLTQRTGLPSVSGAIRLAMSEQRIRCRSEFLALPRHHVDRVVQQDAADFGRRSG